MFGWVVVRAASSSSDGRGYLCLFIGSQAGQLGTVVVFSVVVVLVLFRPNQVQTGQSLESRVQNFKLKDRLTFTFT